MEGDSGVTTQPLPSPSLKLPCLSDYPDQFSTCIWCPSLARSGSIVRPRGVEIERNMFASLRSKVFLNPLCDWFYLFRCRVNIPVLSNKNIAENRWCAEFHHHHRILFCFFLAKLSEGNKINSTFYRNRTAEMFPKRGYTNHCTFTSKSMAWITLKYFGRTRLLKQSHLYLSMRSV